MPTPWQSNIAVENGDVLYQVNHPCMHNLPWLWQRLLGEVWLLSGGMPNESWSLNSTKTQCFPAMSRKQVTSMDFAFPIPTSDSRLMLYFKQGNFPSHWCSQAGMLVGVTFMTISWHLQPLGR